MSGALRNVKTDDADGAPEDTGRTGVLATLPGDQRHVALLHLSRMRTSRTRLAADDVGTWQRKGRELHAF